MLLIESVDALTCWVKLSPVISWPAPSPPPPPLSSSIPCASLSLNHSELSCIDNYQVACLSLGGGGGVCCHPHAVYLQPVGLLPVSPHQQCWSSTPPQKMGGERGGGGKLHVLPGCHYTHSPIHRGLMEVPLPLPLNPWYKVKCHEIFDPLVWVYS